jgi:glycine hydroxymethyltransferase
MSALQITDLSIYQAIEDEKRRQFEGLELIPSENYVSEAVLEAMGSILTNKYSEGYPRHRYYGGNAHIDVIEQEARDRVKQIFGVPYANVQPYSGSPANFAVYTALLNPGDPISGMSLLSGGHLTHGWKVSATAKYFKSYPYTVKQNGEINWDELEEIATNYHPKLIWCGGSAYPRKLDFARFATIADKIGAYLVADIAHIAGLIVGGEHESPVPYVHAVTTTTHKTLRGPRGAIIMVTQKGLDKDPDMGKKIDSAIFPGLQGGPHNHTTAAIAVALKETQDPSFKAYAAQIVKNTHQLADTLTKEHIKLVSGGSDNHLILIDLTPIGPIGILAEYALDIAHITCNKNTIPEDPSNPFYPSGIRIGTPAITTRGFKEKDMIKVGEWIAKVIHHLEGEKIPTDKEARLAYIKAFKQHAETDPVLLQIGKEVTEYTKQFPIPGIKIS